MADGRKRFSHRSGDKWLVPQIVLALLLIGGLVVAVLWLFQPIVADAGSSGQEIRNEEIVASGVEAAGR